MEPLLSREVGEQVKQVFKDLKHPVSILFFSSQNQNCEYCVQTQQLLEEVVALSDLLSLEVFDLDADAPQAKTYEVDKAPGIVLAGRNGNEVVDYGVRFYGIPAGSEFTTLIHDILLVSKRDSGLSQETRNYLRQLTEPLHLQVFVTPT